ncbi:uncharacterized protein LOC134729780 [Pan paniscus]|uniref:uncharacterized protein LOC134729780 n=1 Tax=Pan paniscus TaxID=9597 RepID=UPI00300478BF
MLFPIQPGIGAEEARRPLPLMFGREQVGVCVRPLCVAACGVFPISGRGPGVAVQTSNQGRCPGGDRYGVAGALPAGSGSLHHSCLSSPLPNEGWGSSNAYTQGLWRAAFLAYFRTPKETEWLKAAAVCRGLDVGRAGRAPGNSPAGRSGEQGSGRAAQELSAGPAPAPFRAARASALPSVPNAGSRRSSSRAPPGRAREADRRSRNPPGPGPSPARGAPVWPSARPRRARWRRARAPPLPPRRASHEAGSKGK